MFVYAVLNKKATEVLHVERHPLEIKPELCRNADDGFPIMRLLVDQPKPPVNTLTHKIVGPRYVIRAGFVERHYDPELLTAQEAAARHKARISRIDPWMAVLLRNLFDRVSVLEGGKRLSDQDFEATLADAVTRSSDV